METRAIEKFIDSFVDIWPQAAGGPGHIVLDDYNLGDYHIDWCIELAKAALAESDDIEMLQEAVRLQYLKRGHTAEELRATILFLEILRLIPEDLRDIWGDAE